MTPLPGRGRATTPHLRGRLKPLPAATRTALLACAVAGSGRRRARTTEGRSMTGDQHRYETCRDPRCERPYCRIWREARAEGYRDGYGDGYADGLSAGFAAGVASAGGQS